MECLISERNTGTAVRRHANTTIRLFATIYLINRTCVPFTWGHCEAVSGTVGVPGKLRTSVL